MNIKNNNNNIKITVNSDKVMNPDSARCIQNAEHSPASGPSTIHPQHSTRPKCLRGAVLDRRTTWERLCKIDDWLRAGNYPNAKTMAARLGVSEGTVRRDIKFLIEKRHMPIVWSNKHNGFYYSKPVEGFSKAPLTEADIFSILVAHKALAQYRGTPFEQPLRTAFRKLTGQLDNRELHSITNLGDVLSFKPFAAEESDTKTFETVSKAVSQCRELKFRYRNGGKTRVIPRCVQPYHLLCCDQRWYMLGFDPFQRKVKTYALCRVEKPEVQRRKFARPESFDPDAHFKDSLGVMKGDQKVLYDVTIELDVFGTDLIRGRKFHHTQKLHPFTDGRSRLTMRLANLDELERQILSWGTHAVVIGPECLRDRVGKITSQLAGLYAEPANPTTPTPADTNQLTLLE